MAGGPGYRQPFGDEESYKLLYTQSVLLLQRETSGGELWGNVVGLHQICNITAIWSTLKEFKPPEISVWTRVL